jgi:hypothetical protein
LVENGNEVVTICHGLKFKAFDGKLLDTCWILEAGNAPKIINLPDMTVT